jgi:hypothetical protein
MTNRSPSGGIQVLNKYFISGALLAACSGVLVAAQEPAKPSQTQSRTGAQAPAQTTTVIGCVYREKDVPGRAPNAAERAGVLEDYILAEVSGLASTGATKGATGTAGSGAPSSATGTSGSFGPMYKLEFVDDDKLKAMVGKRVEVTGRIDAEAGDSPAPAAGTQTSTTDKVLGRDRVDLSEFEVSSIKEVSGACPATPSSRP